MAASVSWRARSNSPRATASATWLPNSSSAAVIASLLRGNFPRPICAPFRMAHGAGDVPCALEGGSCASVFPSPCDSVRPVETGASAGSIVGVQVVAGSNPVAPTQCPVVPDVFWSGGAFSRPATRSRARKWLLVVIPQLRREQDRGLTRFRDPRCGRRLPAAGAGRTAGAPFTHRSSEDNPSKSAVAVLLTTSSRARRVVACRITSGGRRAA